MEFSLKFISPVHENPSNDHDDQTNDEYDKGGYKSEGGVHVDGGAVASGPEVEHVSGWAGLPLARRAHAAATCLVPFHVTVEALAASMIVNTLEHTKNYN